MSKEGQNIDTTVDAPFVIIPYDRYFYFSATYSVSVRESIKSFGICLPEFPTRDVLHEAVREINPGARNIVIISINEMKQHELNGLMLDGTVVKPKQVK